MRENLYTDALNYPEFSTSFEYVMARLFRLQGFPCNKTLRPVIFLTNSPTFWLRLLIPPSNPLAMS